MHCFHRVDTVDTISYSDQAKVSSVGAAFIGVGAIAVGPVVDRIVLAKQRAKALLVVTTISPSIIFFLLTVTVPLGKEVRFAPNTRVELWLTFSTVGGNLQ